MGSFSSKESSAAPTTRKRTPPPAISDTDRATLDLKNARDRLQKYKTRLEQDDSKIIARAKQAKADGNFFVEPEAKLLFVMRIRGILKVSH